MIAMDEFTTMVLAGLVASHVVLWYKFGGIERAVTRIETRFNGKA